LYTKLLHQNDFSIFPELNFTTLSEKKGTKAVTGAVPFQKV